MSSHFPLLEILFKIFRTWKRGLGFIFSVSAVFIPVECPTLIRRVPRRVESGKSLLLFFLFFLLSYAYLSVFPCVFFFYFILVTNGWLISSQQGNKEPIGSRERHNDIVTCDPNWDGGYFNPLFFCGFYQLTVALDEAKSSW